MFRKLRSASLRKKEARVKACIDQYKAHPSEALALKITSMLTRLGCWNQGFKWIKHACSDFPRSRKLRQSYRNLKKKKILTSLHRAQLRVQKKPTVESVVQYCELLRLAGKRMKAAKVARKADRKYPDHWQIQLVLGKLKYDDFRRKGDEDDGWAAVEHLDNSRCLEPSNYTTLILLAITLTRLRSFEDALAIIDEVLQVAPEDQRALGLKGRVERVLGEQPSGDLPIGDRTGRQAAASRPSGAAREILERIMKIPGAVGTHHFGAGSKLLDSSVRENQVFNFDVSKDVFESMAAACQFDTHRIGLGEFHSCSLSGEGWSVDYHTTAAGPVLAFFESSFTGENVRNEMESAIGSEGVSTGSENLTVAARS